MAGLGQPRPNDVPPLRFGRADAIVPNDDILDDLRSALREANTKEKKIEALEVAIGNMQALPQGAKNIISNGLEERMMQGNYNPDNDISAIKSELGMEEEGGRRRRRGKKTKKTRKTKKSRRYTRRR